MLKSSVLRYCIYGSCAIISSEILYHSYYWLKKWLKKRPSSLEVHEVIWTNELTQSCAAQHRFVRNSSGGSEPSSPSFSSPSGGVTTSHSTQRNLIKQSTPPVKVSGNECRNSFCAAYNIGRVIQYIDSAQYSIDLAMYTFTSYEVSQAFGRAIQRGVFIRIISDKEMAYSSGSQIIPLTKIGVPVRCNRNTYDLMHHKFCIIDSPTRVAAVLKKLNKNPANNQLRALLMTGSLNWTNQGFANNWENILITSNGEYIKKYSQEYERLWKVFDSVIE